jgi:hypothetical protein
MRVPLLTFIAGCPLFRCRRGSGTRDESSVIEQIERLGGEVTRDHSVGRPRSALISLCD